MKVACLVVKTTKREAEQYGNAFDSVRCNYRKRYAAIINESQSESIPGPATSNSVRHVMSNQRVPKRHVMPSFNANHAEVPIP
jgi:hypothetical protein